MIVIYTKNTKSVHALHFNSKQLKSMFLVQNHVHFINENQRL
jgi:hypothetical protein